MGEAGPRVRPQRYRPAIRERDLETILSIYAVDATYMPPGRPLATGRAQLREIWGEYLRREDFVAEYTPTLHVSDAGDMAYDIGRYRISMVKDGAPVSFVGKYVVVWKQVNGEWRAMLDMDNDNGPGDKG